MAYVRSLPSQNETAQDRIAVSADGQVWQLTETWRTRQTWDSVPSRRVGRQLSGAGKDADKSVPLAVDWSERMLVDFDSYSSPKPWGAFLYVGMSNSKAFGNNIPVFMRSGRLYIYDTYTGLQAVVTPQGVFTRLEAAIGSFDGLVSASLVRFRRGYSAFSDSTLWGDKTGLYQFDLDTAQVRRLTDVPVESFAPTLRSMTEQPSLWVRSTDHVRRFIMSPMNASKNVPNIFDELPSNHALALPQISLTEVEKWPIDAPLANRTKPFQVASTEKDDEIVVVESGMSRNQKFHRVKGTGEVIESGQYSFHVPRGPSLEFLIAPPGLALVGLGTQLIYGWNGLSIVPLEFVYLLVHFAFAVALCFWLTGRRALNRQARLLWSIVGGLLSAGTWLAIVAIYPRVVTQACSRCQANRRIDAERCDHCGAEWDKPDNDGNELIGLSDQSTMSIDLQSAR